MKYVVNSRGGAKTVDEQALPGLLKVGYIEITKHQFETSKYYPEYDKGPTHTNQPAPSPKLQIKNIHRPDRPFFETRIV